MTDSPSPIKTVLIDVDLGGSIDYPLDQVYDGDYNVMKDYEAQGVIDSMKAAGSKYDALSDWALIDYDDVEINVTVIREDGSRSYASW